MSKTDMWLSIAHFGAAIAAIALSWLALFFHQTAHLTIGEDNVTLDMLASCQVIRDDAEGTLVVHWENPDKREAHRTLYTLESKYQTTSPTAIKPFLGTDIDGQVYYVTRGPKGHRVYTIDDRRDALHAYLIMGIFAGGYLLAYVLMLIIWNGLMKRRKRLKRLSQSK